jgi:uncharacterized protein YyaL (SSP411 family)
LEQVNDLWQTRKADLDHSAADIHAKLEQLSTSQEGGAVLLLTTDVLREAGMAFKNEYDPRQGGFGGSPKFPQPSRPEYLLRFAKRFHDDEAVRMVLHTCDRMAAGGIHDQLGGGFARYSVDAEWLVPHFEKMLYDNAQLAMLYLDGFVVSGDTRYAEVARDILAYVLRDMTHPGGGFYSAEDADSEGHEGKFYCWTREELSALLSPEEFKVAVRYFGISDAGNFVDHSHPKPLQGQNVLSIVQPNLAETEKALLGSAKKKMFDTRSKRVRPHLDDKVLASWNGLMLGAMARAYAVLGGAAYLRAAENNLAFVQAKLWDAKTGTLYHRWRDGERDHVQLLASYAFLLSGVLELYEATVQPERLDFALALAEAMLSKFYDAENGGFWQSAAGAKDLILRVKEDYDGAEPSPNSVAILALLKLGKISDRKDFTAAGEKSLRFFANRLRQFPQALPHMLQALDFSMDEPRRAVVAGDPAQRQTRALLYAVHSAYQPNKVVLGNQGAVESFAKSLPAKSGPVVYVCTGSACLPPASEPDKIKELMK